MVLSDQERRALEEIEWRLQADDPTLAGRMAVETDTAGARRSDRWAWFGLLFGLQVTLVGFAAAGGLISFGTIIGLYGLLVLTGSATALLSGLRHRRRPTVPPRSR